MAQAGRVLTAIAFDQAALHPLRGRYEVAFSPRLNFYQGRSQPELLVLDLAPAPCLKMKNRRPCLCLSETPRPSLRKTKISPAQPLDIPRMIC